MEHYRLQSLLIRAITALCGLAAVESEDVRMELTDEAAWGMQVWMDTPGADRFSKLRIWCEGAVSLVGRSASSERAFLRAQLALLRLRASLPTPAPKPSVSGTSSPKPIPSKLPSPKILKFSPSQGTLLKAIRSSGPIRSRDLITLLAGALSDRTVKRTLKDLASAGLLRRTQQVDGVMYEAVVDNS